MLSWALVYIVVILSTTSCSQPFPLYSGTNLVPAADVFQRGAADSEEQEHTDSSLTDDSRQIKSLLPLLLPQGQDPQATLRDIWLKGTKDSSQQDKLNSMVDDIQAAVLKLAAAENLRTHSLLRSDQSSPKTKKRACFWKYCVTN
ncbi:urotensin-related peptide 1 [Amia ocellicauda]|uniref:urotensin-related peptide 1 n=1 Tax=Amia ocellicauda TaxID=2972642 RepID=UPI00346429C2